MDNFFRTDIILDSIKIEEELLESIRKIKKADENINIASYIKEENKIKMYTTKEERLIKKIPKNVEVLNFIKNFVQTPNQINICDEQNKKYVISRFLSVINNIFLNLEPQDLIFYDEYGEEKYYDDEELEEQRKEKIISQNLMKKYLKRINKIYEFAESSKTKSIFKRIEQYNIYIDKELSDLWVYNNLDIKKIDYLSDSEMRKKLKLTEEEYLEVKEEVILEIIQNLLLQLLYEEKNHKNKIETIDSILNFKFLLEETQTETLINLKDEFDKFYKLTPKNSKEKEEILSEIITSFEKEINKRDDIPEEEIEPNLEQPKISLTTFNKLVELIKLEEKIYQKFEELDFNKKDDEKIKELDILVNYEKEKASQIDISISILPVVQNLFNYNLWIYLDDDNLISKNDIIKQRLYNVLPIFTDLYVPSFQNKKSYDFIQKNHMIECLKDYYVISNSISNPDVKNEFMQVYEDYFLINPDLTEELISSNGNHKFIDVLSDDIIVQMIGSNEYEYKYDRNEQLFNIISVVCIQLLTMEEEVETAHDLALLQFKLIEFANIVNKINLDKLKKLLQLIKDNGSISSQIRKETIKLVKQYISEKEKKNKVYHK